MALYLNNLAPSFYDCLRFIITIIGGSSRVWPTLDLKIEIWPSGTKRYLRVLERGNQLTSVITCLSKKNMLQHEDLSPSH